MESKKVKRRLHGVVVSNKSQKTLVVSVVSRFKHAKYSKFVHSTAKYYAHDEKNEAQIGDKVVIIESRPLSKLKRWQLLQIKK